MLLLIVEFFLSRFLSLFSGKLYGLLKQYFNMVVKNSHSSRPDVSLYGFIYDQISSNPPPEPTAAYNSPPDGH